ncbi:MAG: thiamine pyrophosphate-dependent enzyme, partial [Gemmataceae bacterium]|nr:thiamine pyrophosphate-dependent enzyme [Gemmataceae bacterium]
HRGDRIVIPTMGAVGVWPEWSDSAADFFYMPSSMGQGPALGLGLALAQPRRGVIVLTGDGSLLMNLGCLVTIAQHPANLWVILLDNGQYEITGGQPVPGSRRTNFAQIAEGAGITRVYSFQEAASWDASAGEVFDGVGPVFVWLRVEPRAGQRTPHPPRPMSEQISRLQTELGLDPHR